MRCKLQLCLITGCLFIACQKASAAEQCSIPVLRVVIYISIKDVEGLTNVDMPKSLAGKPSIICTSKSVGQEVRSANDFDCRTQWKTSVQFISGSPSGLTSSSPTSGQYSGARLMSSAWVKARQAITLKHLSRQIEIEESLLTKLNGVSEHHVFGRREWVVLPTSSIRKAKMVSAVDTTELRRTPPLAEPPVPTGTPRIQRGDNTLAKVAQRYNISIQKLLKLNPGLRGAQLVLGTPLRIGVNRNDGIQFKDRNGRSILIPNSDIMPRFGSTPSYGYRRAGAAFEDDCLKYRANEWIGRYTRTGEGTYEIDSKPRKFIYKTSMYSLIGSPKSLADGVRGSF